MIFVNETSLDFRNIPLRTKKREAIKKLKNGTCYITYVLKQDGKLIQFELNPKLSKGYSVKTHKPTDFIINLSK